MTTLPPSRAERTTESYRGFELVRERMGHTNVQTGRGFVGGYRSATEAREAVDAIVDRPTYRRATVAEKIARGVEPSADAWITA